MKHFRLAMLSFAWVILFEATLAFGKDEVRLESASKVSTAKNDDREKTATNWMPVQELTRLFHVIGPQRRQVIFVEYNAGRDMWRGVYTDKIKLGGASWSFVGEDDLEQQMNEEIKKGLKPAFIAKNRKVYSMLFVTPEQYTETRKILDELGVGEPKLK